MAKKKNVSIDRCIQGYPPQYYYRLCVAYITMKDETMSRFVTDRAKDFFNKMTESEREMILKYEKQKK